MTPVRKCIYNDHYIIPFFSLDRHSSFDGCGPAWRTQIRNEVLMSKKLEDKVAVITGASKGIGKAIAAAMADEGASVVLNYASDKAGADDAVREIRSKGGKAISVQADLSNFGDIERLFSETWDAFGRVDTLVNNAGVYEFRPLEEVTPEHFHKQFNINVLGLILASKEAAKYMGGEGGSIINVSSLAATAAMSGASVYSATKGAVNTITLSLSQELGPRKIRVNSLSPGMVETEGFHTAGLHGSAMQVQVEQATPLGRIGLPTDIAPIAVFLASDQDSGWLTGQVVVASGGQR